MKKHASDATVMRFLRALYPGNVELAVAAFDEETVLTLAAEILERLKPVEGMPDIVTRLRDHERHAVHDRDDDCLDAAATIERLRVEVELLDSVQEAWTAHRARLKQAEDTRSAAQAESTKNLLETRELREELAKLRERLGPIDPGGGDRIDELEAATEFLRHRAETAEGLADDRWGIIQRLTKQHNEWKAAAEAAQSTVARVSEEIRELRLAFEAVQKTVLALKQEQDDPEPEEARRREVPADWRKAVGKKIRYWTHGANNTVYSGEGYVKYIAEGQEPSLVVVTSRANGAAGLPYTVHVFPFMGDVWTLIEK